MRAALSKRPSILFSIEADKRYGPTSPVKDDALNISEFLTLPAGRIVAQQQRLDAEYVERLENFRPVFESARAAGYETLARGLVPQAVVLNNVELELTVSLSRRTEVERAVGIRLLHLGLMSRYGRSDFARSKMVVKVERVPCAPGTSRT